MVKYIFITGNILGFKKSIFVASISALFKENNLNITIKKINKYKPTKTFVTDDGSEVDLNLGYYERITEIITNSNNNLSLCQFYKQLEYIDNEIIKFIELDSINYDIIIIEFVDVYVNVIKYFFEKYGQNNIINIHILSKYSLITKYIQPNIILSNYDCLKFMNINIYKIPYLLFKFKFYSKVLKLLKIPQNNNLTKWKKIYNDLSNLNEIVYVYVIINFSVSYISLIEALKHASYSLNKKIKIIWLDPSLLTKTQLIDKLKEKKGGILVPGGFGKNGFENKIEAVKFARENNISFLGICYGMQIMVIEYARNILEINNASTEEIDYSNEHTHIVHLIGSKIKRLGSYMGKIKKNSIAKNIYNSDIYIERYRHKYKINNKYTDKFEKNGLIFTGESLDKKYLEIAEIPSKKFFIGVQFHPELISTIFKPHPIIISFIKSILD
jgi:CTP synthase